MTRVDSSRKFTKKLEFRIEGRPSKHDGNLMDFIIEGPLDEFIKALEAAKTLHSSLIQIHKEDLVRDRA